MRDIYQYFDNFEKYRDIGSDLVIEGKVDNPMLSIFIPTYKRANTLETTIKSVITQKTDYAFEIIIVNNDSEEGYRETKELIERINDDRIYYYVNCENIGLCGNWNRGIELARCDYISMIHDDDILSPYFVEKVIETINEKHPGIIGVNCYNFTSDNIPKFTKPSCIEYRNVSKESFFFGKYITIAGMTVRKELILSLGGYSEEYYPNEDTVLIYQSLLRENVLNIEHPLAGYRKEINLSLSDGTMKSIILMTEATRRNIAKYEKFASKWLKKYDKEYLYQYIIGANNTWGLKLNYTDIFDAVGFQGESFSRFKLLFMKIELKMVSLGGRK